MCAPKKCFTNKSNQKCEQQNVKGDNKFSLLLPFFLSKQIKSNENGEWWVSELTNERWKIGFVISVNSLELHTKISNKQNIWTMYRWLLIKIQYALS